MNTTEKGNQLEKQVFELITFLVNNGQFLVDGKNSRVFWKKGYYSRDREKEIIFDVSIEVSLPGETNYSLLILIECKNYNTPVTIDDVEEFSSKMKGIGEHNIKGFLITNHSFQGSCLTYAKNKKIGLATVNEFSTLQWVNQRKEAQLTGIGHTLSIAPTEYKETSVFEDKIKCYYEDKAFNNFQDFLIQAGAFDFFPTPNEIVPFLDQDHFEKIPGSFCQYKVYKNNKLDIDALCEEISLRYDADFLFDTDLGQSNDGKLLGKLTFSPIRIHVCSCLKNDPHRWRFTVVHEIAHLLIHYNLLCRFWDHNKTINPYYALLGIYSQKTASRMEIQANLLTSSLLMPDYYLLPLVKAYFMENSIYKGFLVLDDQPINFELVFNLLRRISNAFEVSLEVAKLRMVKMNRLQIANDRSLYRILKEHY